ncbi:hypothetical protein B0H63DRAFT_557473 [Podospora didyma]|uniref:Uncharacterized protein n=1 Tax=Podospora didyma TaxID=330526 RepID=A0AAE0NZZ0_9PEZI|nr:hypothetical protein B0H63DRAFT_557473 [Podospora didyma]
MIYGSRRVKNPWYTFWIAVMIFIAAVTFCIVQCVEGALQVYISFKARQQGEKQPIVDNGTYPSYSGTAVQGHPSALLREELTPYGDDKGDIGQDARAESVIADMEPVELYASTAQCSTSPAAAPANKQRHKLALAGGDARLHRRRREEAHPDGHAREFGARVVDIGGVLAAFLGLEDPSLGGPCTSNARGSAEIRPPGKKRQTIGKVAATYTSAVIDTGDGRFVFAIALSDMIDLEHRKRNEGVMPPAAVAMPTKAMVATGVIPLAALTRGMARKQSNVNTTTNATATLHEPELDDQASDRVRDPLATRQLAQRHALNALNVLPEDDETDEPNDDQPPPGTNVAPPPPPAAQAQLGPRDPQPGGIQHLIPAPQPAQPVLSKSPIRTDSVAVGRRTVKAPGWPPNRPGHPDPSRHGPSYHSPAPQAITATVAHRPLTASVVARNTVTLYEEVQRVADGLELLIRKHVARFPSEANRLSQHMCDDLELVKGYGVRLKGVSGHTQ